MINLFIYQLYAKSLYFVNGIIEELKGWCYNAINRGILWLNKKTMIIYMM